MKTYQPGGRFKGRVMESRTLSRDTGSKSSGDAVAEPLRSICASTPEVPHHDARLITGQGDGCATERPMPETDALARLGRSMAARGYVVVAHFGKGKKPGDIIQDARFDQYAQDVLGIPVRVICETDEADFREHCRLAGKHLGDMWDVIKSLRHPKFYRLEAD